MKFLLFVLISLGVSQYCFADCDVTATARETVKAIVALGDIKGILGYYGGVTDTEPSKTTVAIELRYADGSDFYHVVIRNSDCRIIDAALVKEK